MNKEEIFTIGDKCEKGIISSFSILGNDLLITYNNGLTQPLKNAVKSNTSLFTTEDGVDIFEGDLFWNINNQFQLSELQITNNKYELVFLKPENKCKQFSTKEAAEEYILMNKPCLSYNDISDLVKDGQIWWLKEELKKLVKSKL